MISSLLFPTLVVNLQHPPLLLGGGLPGDQGHGGVAVVVGVRVQKVGSLLTP